MAKLKTKQGFSLIESLVCLVIIGIGFVAINQLTSFAIVSIDRSIEKNKINFLAEMMIEDIELMENLGIYEVSPEDFALCEFVCTSKIEVQKIIRHGLDLVRKENS